MVDVDTAQQIPSWAWPIFAAIGVPSLGGLFIWRKWSTTKREVAEDKQQTNVIKVVIDNSTQLQEENSKLRAQMTIMAKDHNIEMRDLAKERNDAVSAMGKLSATIEFMSQTINGLRDEQRQGLAAAASGREKISEAIEKHTDLTREVKVEAQQAYKEANTVNTKIKNIGLQVRDGSPLSDHEAPQRRKSDPDE